MIRRAFCAWLAAGFCPAAFAQTPPGRADARNARAAADSDFSGRGPVPHFTAEEAIAFAKQIERDLAGREARLALVFRTGRARSRLPDGIRYTHGAFWAYTPIRTEDAETVHGYAVYNLYRGDGDDAPRDRSYLRQDFPVDFVSGSAVDDVGVIIPSPEVQRRILIVMASPLYERLHVPSFSLVANPHNARHQNCNEFMLDVIASAAWETSDYEQIKANLRRHFRPTRVRASLFQRVLGPLADSSVRTDDQSGAILTTTFESMATFLRENGLLQEAYAIDRATAEA
jgi:hypothetical protein